MVIVLNDDHNTFDHVAHTLSSVIPGVSLDRGYRYAPGKGCAARGDGCMLVCPDL